MDLLSAAERLAAIDRSAVTLIAERCLHSVDTYSTCQACWQLCPEGAIQAGKPPTLAGEKCTACLACLPVCPVGAFSADDSLQGLLNCAARLETAKLELTCARHPSSQLGLPDATAVQVRGCLAGLGASAYFALASMGVEKVFARTDACAGCPWGGLVTHIESQVAAAGRFLEQWDKAYSVASLGAQPEGGFSQRPLWDANNPPLSRRDLFRLASRQGQIAAARALAKDQPAAGHRPPRERQRMLSALNRLVEERQGADISLSGLGFVNISISESCTACGVCARACPTAALELDEEKETSYQLKFSFQACTGCEVCVHVCAPAALTLQTDAPSIRVLGQTEPIILRSGEFRRCERCNALIAAAPGVSLCPTCQFRRANPFGSRMPPGIKPKAGG